MKEIVRIVASCSSQGEWKLIQWKRAMKEMKRRIEPRVTGEQD